MIEHRFDPSQGDWTRCIGGPRAGDLARWPGPHGPGTHIVLGDRTGHYEYDRTVVADDGVREHRYVWVSTAEPGAASY